MQDDVCSPNADEKINYEGWKVLISAVVVAASIKQRGRGNNLSLNGIGVKQQIFAEM